MAKDKVTITLDRRKANKARALTACRSTSEVIDLALDHLIDLEVLRRDVAAYRRLAPTAEERSIAQIADRQDLADDTDWEALYPTDSRS